MEEKKVAQKCTKKSSSCNKKASKQTFSWRNTCVRETVLCIECSKPRCLFARSTLSKEQKLELQRNIENNDFVCGTKLIDEESPLPNDIIFQEVNLNCSTPVEHQYYNLSKINESTSGQRLQFQTDKICVICCSKEDLLMQEDIENKVDCAGKKFLPIYTYCFNQC